MDSSAATSPVPPDPVEDSPTSSASDSMLHMETRNSPDSTSSASTSSSESSSSSPESSSSISEPSSTSSEPSSLSGPKIPSLQDLLDSYGHITKNQEEVMTSKFISPVKITFCNASEKKRQESNIVPPSFFRTGYETSITLSAYVSKDTHAKHREQPRLKITIGNAFQAVGLFSLLEDLNRERIERQLIWNKKKNPSSYISVFNELCHALRRAGFHYDDSQRIGHRVYIAEISSRGLVAATVSGRIRTTVKIYTKRRFLPDLVHSEDHDFDVDIPVWIRDPRDEKDRTDLTDEEFTKLGAEMWISVTELRRSNLKNGPKSKIKSSRNYICAKGHNYEWLACGTIPKSRVIKVMPFDGTTLFKERTTRIIGSRESTEPWVWDWDQERWVLDAARFALAKCRDKEEEEAREARNARKRGANKEMDEDLEQPPPPSKLAARIEVNLVRPYLNLFRKNSTPTR